MPTPAVVDISHHNTIPDSLKPAKAAGIVGIIHKLTEGTSFTDDKCAARYFLAGDAKMAWGVYHFIQPGDPIAQANYFLDRGKALGVIDDDTLLALDWEVSDVSADKAVMFLAQVEARTGRVPVLYSGHVYKEQPDPRLAAYRLWLAQYSSSCTLPTFADDYWLWQYTDAGNVPGITPPTDLNQAGVPVSQLLAEWSGGAVVEPDVKVVSVIISAPEGVRVEVQVIEGDNGG